MQLTMPPDEVFNLLAMRAERRRKAETQPVGPNTMADHIEYVRNGYLIAKTQAEQVTE